MRTVRYTEATIAELVQVLAEAHARLDERDAARAREGGPATPPVTPTRILMRGHGQ